MKESLRTPKEWRFLCLVETGRGRYAIRLRHTFNPIDAGIRKAAKLHGKAITEKAFLQEAVETGGELEAWIVAQNENAKESRRKK